MTTSHWGGAKAGWRHLWDCDAEKLRDALVKAGLVPTWVYGVPPGWPPNTHQWPVDFEARFVCRRDDSPWPEQFPSDFQVVS